MQRRALLAFGAASLVGCGPKKVAPPPSAPAVLSAGDLLPADLDVVVRLDLGKVKAALGAAALAVLAREGLSRAGAGEHADELVLESLLAADLVYLAYRPGPLLEPLDRVLALQGSFEAIARPPLGFAAPVDLGADVRYFERRSTSSLGRGGVARMYTASTRVRAFVSEAEIDAVERALETGGAERRLQAPEEGTLSLAARPRLLTRFGGSGLREQLEAARTLRAIAELESDGVKLKLEIEMKDAPDAERLAGAGRAVLQRVGGEWAERAEIRADGSRLVLTAQLQRSQLAPLVGCLGQGSGSECAW
jgi:hypothetical protein